MNALRAAAWSVFAADAAIVIVWLGVGLAGNTSVERDTTAGLALLAAIPLGLLFVALFFSSRKGGRIGLWICLALGSAPLFFLIEMVGEQHGLWPRM